jgi:hypothetical protein
MPKREIKNIIPKPNYVGVLRQVHGVLRNHEGFMVFSVIEKSEVIYKLTNILDLPIKPNNIGRRGFDKRWISFLQSHILDSNYRGDLFMYCTHQKEQKLLSISNFTINKKNTQYYRVDTNGFPYQPYCKESKRLYQNGPGNKLRTSDQHIEGSQGSRTRGLLTAICCDNKLPSIEELFIKFNSRCFDTGKLLDINDRGSFEIDHLMPASGYHPLNTQTAVLLCTESNQKKNDIHPLKFYGVEKLIKLCSLLDFNIEDIKDDNYILNDKVLYYFNDNFEYVMNLWYGKNRNKKSFNKYLIKETNRISRKDIYSRHKQLIKKLEEYGNAI